MGDITRGAIAGALAATAFALSHALMISNIWFMLAPMLLAGALCGAALAHSYAQLDQSTSILSWVRYNLLYTLLLFLVMPVSVMIYEPAMTLSSLLTSQGGMPTELTVRLLPLVISFTIVISLAVLVMYRATWGQFWSVLLSSSLLMMLLGSNLSAMGLITLTSGWQYIFLETTLLILTTNGIFVISYLGLVHVQASTMKRILIQCRSLVHLVFSGWLDA